MSPPLRTSPTLRGPCQGSTPRSRRRRSPPDRNWQTVPTSWRATIHWQHWSLRPARAALAATEHTESAASAAMPKKLRYAAQQTGHFGKKANANDASVARTGGADLRHRWTHAAARGSCYVPYQRPRLVQHLDRTRHDLPARPSVCVRTMRRSGLSHRECKPRCDVGSPVTR